MARSRTAVSSCGCAPCPVSIRVWMHAAAVSSGKSDNRWNPDLLVAVVDA